MKFCLVVPLITQTFMNMDNSFFLYNEEFCFSSLIVTKLSSGANLTV